MYIYIYIHIYIFVYSLSHLACITCAPSVVKGVMSKSSKGSIARFSASSKAALSHIVCAGSMNDGSTLPTMRRLICPTAISSPHSGKSPVTRGGRVTLLLSIYIIWVLLLLRIYVVSDHAQAHLPHCYFQPAQQEKPCHERGGDIFS